MKKITKILCKVMPIVLVGLLVVSNVFGVTFDPSAGVGGSKSSTVTTLANNVWATIASIVQILAIAAVVFAGVRYMLASANDKADIKKQLIVLVLGAVLVFGASTVLKAINTVTSEIAPSI